MTAMFFAGTGAVIGFALGVRAGDRRMRAIEAFKLLGIHFEDFIHGGTFAIGATVRGGEISAGPREWVCGNYEPGMLIVLVRFDERDVLEYPGERGKQYRVTRCKVIRAVNPAEVGV